MSEITTIGLDLAKSVFQVHEADRDGRPVVRKTLRRRECGDMAVIAAGQGLDLSPPDPKATAPPYAS